MKTKKSKRSTSSVSTRSRALAAGKEHRARLEETVQFLRSSPEAQRRDLGGMLKRLAAAGLVKPAEHKELVRILALITKTSKTPATSGANGPAIQVRAIHQGLRKQSNASPVALVVAGIAEDSTAHAAKLSRKVGARAKGRSNRPPSTPTPYSFPVAVADVGGAILAGAWCIKNGKSLSFTIDEMITGAIYLSAAAAGTLSTQ